MTSQDGNKLDTSEFTGSRKLKIEPSQLEDGTSYAVSVSVKNKFTSKTTSKNITLTRVSDSGLTVEILGPSTIRSDQILRLKAKSKICGSEATAASTFSVNFVLFLVSLLQFNFTSTSGPLMVLLVISPRRVTRSLS